MGHIKGEKACNSQIGDKLVIDKLSISINHIIFLWVCQGNKSTWNVRRTIKMLVTHLPLSNYYDNIMTFLASCEYPNVDLL